ncbi:uncharacterized protein Z520_09828 [Fonsecaea multimorphosa CBS 102226]|uniref:Heterokaryon incompatibility domain-containing protein n=1 Tax=Fonsecaea multimorphosa CBS 102226 TaxID=1442371 RepID=A0A0D2JMB9_9EURO|nr:uncharacterized protein Z520_09828 [Fonsecaea multimorphosa CBS 102226]KIX94442.1 hypothetical protein Z520_09828 [Fonsecaea multimorphosa CBS 102226]OAL20023.1 hypothetical protein AYO22_09173 [Fonsecaea multimorphosa]
MAVTFLEVLRWIIVGIFAPTLVFSAIYVIWRAGFTASLAFIIGLRWLRGPALWLTDAFAFVPSKVTSSIRSLIRRKPPKNLKRRHFLTRFPKQDEFPSTILNDKQTNLENLFASYGRYLNLHADVAETNATLFRIRKWLRTCEWYHKSDDNKLPQCTPLHGSDHGAPVWLIDIEQCCLVPYEHSFRYIALSYVWGKIETAKTLRSNLDALQQPRSLLGPTSVVQLPTTVRDAVFLTGYLGLRYLWCDRLCIVQDDPTSKHSQVRQMAEIYARAYCTIVALDNSSAESGLHGIPNICASHRHRENGDMDLEKAVWPSRAWTWQEELFSVRIIWMSASQVSWQCSCMPSSACNRGKHGQHHNAQKRTLPDISDEGTSVQIGGMLCPQRPSLKFYTTLVQDYSQRHVHENHPEDIFHAFSSIQVVLSRTYPGDFIQCIPACFFAPCLLWSPRQDGLCRRMIKDEVGSVMSASWSWVDWSGPVDFQRMTADPYMELCQCVVSWSVSESITPESVTVVRAAAEAWKDHKEFTAFENGMKSVAYAPQPCLPPAAIDNPVQGTTFCEPRSTSGDCETAAPISHLGTHGVFLHGRVLYGQFRVDEKDYITGQGIRLESCTTGKFAGVLGRCSPRLGANKVINFIAISRGEMKIKHQRFVETTPSEAPAVLQNRYGQTFEYRKEDLPEEYHVSAKISTGACGHASCTRLEGLELDRLYSPKEVYEFYDAMWVDWENGVAYRRGLARIAKDVWELETLGWIDVTLG